MEFSSPNLVVMTTFSFDLSKAFLAYAIKGRVAAPLRIAVLGMMTIGVAPVSHASVIVSNLTQTPAGTFAGTTHLDDAQSFMVPTASETLLDVVVELFGNGGTDSFSLYTDKNGIPFNALGAIGTVTPTGSTFATYTITHTELLTPGQTYWLLTNYTGGQNWAYTNSTSFTGTGTLGAAEYSLNGGATWLASPNGPFMLQIDATTATPEPATLLLLVFPLAGLGMLKVRQHRLERQMLRQEGAHS
jgi:hypothetical protein